MSQPLFGPLPFPSLPAQPRFPTYCTNWGAYDVPRIWDVVRPEDDRLGWEQVVGFRRLADLLVDHYRRLRAQHVKLGDAWRSPAAEVVLSRVDAYAKALLSDAHCARTTSNALDTIMNAYAEAHVRMAPLVMEWNNVTTDWRPEWWDHEADRLNNEARDIMIHTDNVVRDHRPNIIIPDVLQYGRRYPAAASVTEGGSSDIAPESLTRTAPPPIPGRHPVLSTESGAELSGMPTLVQAVPGQPVSMLPVPPGSPHAPSGGAYVLPGPGVGSGGYIVSLPGATGRSSISSPTGGRGGPISGPPAIRPGMAGSPGSATGSGLMPMALGSQQPGQGRSDGGPKRNPNTQWHVEQGVPPVIEGISDDTVILNQPSQKQEDDFREWFAELAYPWRSERANENEPHIVLRKVPG